MSNKMESKQRNNQLYQRIPWKKAIAFGLIAFILGFVLISGLNEVEGVLQDDASQSTNEAELEEEPGYVTNQAWVFFSAHFVDIEGTASTGLGNIQESVDILSNLEELPAVVFYLAPILALVTAGFAIVTTNTQLLQSELEGALSGAVITAGYLPAVVFSALIFDHQTQLEELRVSYEVPLVDAALIAGLLLPTVFGAVGGYIAYSRR